MFTATLFIMVQNCTQHRDPPQCWHSPSVKQYTVSSKEKDIYYMMLTSFKKNYEQDRKKTEHILISKTYY